MFTSQVAKGQFLAADTWILALHNTAQASLCTDFAWTLSLDVLIIWGNFSQLKEIFCLVESQAYADYYS